MDGGIQGMWPWGRAAGNCCVLGVGCILVIMLISQMQAFLQESLHCVEMAGAGVDKKKEKEKKMAEGITDKNYTIVVVH